MFEYKKIFTNQKDIINFIQNNNPYASKTNNFDNVIIC
jgi:hypothetical protein